MLTIQGTEDKLRDKLEKTYTKPGKGSSASLAYLKVGAVALAMNEAFGPCGWDVLLDKIEILKGAHKIDGGGREDAAGSYWNAIAYAIVTVKARSLFKPDGTYVEVSRTDVGLGSAVGGKQKTQVDALQNALTSATTNALKRACRFFGPKTGLTLQFEPGEREAIQRALDVESQAQEGTAEIEGGNPATISVTEDLMDGSTQVAAEAPAVPVAPPAVNGTSDHTEVLASFAAADLLERIKSLDGPETQVPLDDVKAFHKAMATAFGPHEAVGLWSTAGVTLGQGVVVRRKDIFGVAQVIEEATAAEGGLEGFLAQYRPAQTPAAPEQKFVEGVKYDDAALAASATEKAASEVTSHGEQIQQAWDDSSFKITERREKYSKIFGTRAPEVVEILAGVPDDAELTKEDAAKIHSVGLKIIQEMNVPAAEVYAIWKKIGFVFGAGQPRGRQARAFADSLPQ